MKYTDPKTGKFIKGNPGGGRPKGFSIVAHLKEKLQEVPEGQKESYATLITKKYLHKALVEGDTAILKDLFDRVDGKALQAVKQELKIESLVDEKQAKTILNAINPRD